MRNEVATPMVLHIGTAREPRNYFECFGVSEYNEECIYDRQLESKVLMDRFPGLEIDGDDACYMLWDCLKPNVKDDLIEKYVERHEAEFARIFNEWWEERSAMYDDDPA